MSTQYILFRLLVWPFHIFLWKHMPFFLFLIFGLDFENIEHMQVPWIVIYHNPILLRPVFLWFWLDLINIYLLNKTYCLNIKICLLSEIEVIIIIITVILHLSVFGSFFTWARFFIIFSLASLPFGFLIIQSTEK